MECFSSYEIRNPKERKETIFFQHSLAKLIKSIYNLVSFEITLIRDNHIFICNYTRNIINLIIDIELSARFLCNNTSYLIWGDTKYS